MTEIVTVDWFGRWGTFVLSENTAIFLKFFSSMTAGFNISSAIRLAIQNQWFSGLNLGTIFLENMKFSPYNKSV